MNRRRRNRTATEIQKQIDRTTGVYRARTSNARRNARGDRATTTLENAVGRRFVNDPTGKYGGESRAVYDRRTGKRIGTMVNAAH